MKFDPAIVPEIETGETGLMFLFSQDEKSLWPKTSLFLIKFRTALLYSKVFRGL